VLVDGRWRGVVVMEGGRERERDVGDGMNE